MWRTQIKVRIRVSKRVYKEAGEDRVEKQTLPNQHSWRSKQSLKLLSIIRSKGRGKPATRPKRSWRTKSGVVAIREERAWSTVLSWCKTDCRDAMGYGKAGNLSFYCRKHTLKRSRGSCTVHCAGDCPVYYKSHLLELLILIIQQ